MLMLHADSDGTWEPAGAQRLESELRTIKAELGLHDPVDIPPGWHREVMAVRGLRPRSLAECYVDVDGEFLLDRLIEVAHLAQERASAIWFQ